MTKQYKRLALLFAFVAVLTAILWMRSDTAQGATSVFGDKQSVVGYAFTDECVVANQRLEIPYVLTNRSATRRTVIVWHYGVGTDEGSIKGPMLDIDTTRSGLIPSSDPWTWYWRITLKPGETVTKSIFVKTVPEPYSLPEPWDPNWGPKPVLRFYSGATVNVKSSTVVFYPNVSPAYCA